MSLAYGIEPRAFCAHLWPAKWIWSGDIDRRADKQVLAVLARKTATSMQRAFATTLKAYEGQLFAHLKPNGTTQWLLFNAMNSQCRRLPALQYCPQCLLTDAHPYFRRHWRLGFVTLCPIHRRHLLDRCPACREPVNFHRLPSDAQILTVCYRCQFDLRLADTQALEENSVQRRLVTFQTFLLQALATSRCQLSTHGAVAACDYFRVLHQLARLLGTHRHAEYRRAKLCRELGQPYFEPCFPSLSRRAVEVLPVTDRCRLMQLLAWWLDDWPNRFIEVCLDNWLWPRELLERMPSPPSWYEETAQQASWSNALARVLHQWQYEIPDGNL